MTDGNVRKLLLAEKELKQRLVDGDEYIEELQNKWLASGLQKKMVALIGRWSLYEGQNQ